MTGRCSQIRRLLKSTGETGFKGYYYYYNYYYTRILLWWRYRITAARPPYNVTVAFRRLNSNHNCSAGTQNVSGSQYTGKHSLNSTVFSSWRKVTKVGAFLAWVGREFQALAAAAGKALSPNVERRVDGTINVDVSHFLVPVNILWINSLHFI